MATFQTLINDARKQVTGTNTLNWPDTDIFIDFNNGLDEVASIIQKADGAWQWEDTNNTTELPIGTTNIVSGQQDYGIDLTFLKLERLFIHVSPTDITWHEITYNPDKSKFLNKNSTNDVGIPREFTIIGNSIVFDCFPNYSCTLGLKALFARNVKYVGDGTGGTVAVTATPGFNLQYHKYLSLYAQRERLEGKEQKAQQYNKIVARMIQMRKDIQNFYSSRKKASPFNLKNNINIDEYR